MSRWLRPYKGSQWDLQCKKTLTVFVNSFLQKNITERTTEKKIHLQKKLRKSVI